MSPTPRLTPLFDAGHLDGVLALGLAVPNWAVNLMIVGFIFISVLMMLVVLIQRPQGGGLSGAFGASSEGAGQTALGVKTGDVLTMFTIGVFIAFLGVAVVLNYATRPEARAQAAQAAAQTGSDPGGQPVGDEAGQATQSEADAFTGDEAQDAIGEAIDEAADAVTGNADDAGGGAEGDDSGAGGTGDGQPSP